MVQDFFHPQYYSVYQCWYVCKIGSSIPKITIETGWFDGVKHRQPGWFTASWSFAAGMWPLIRQRKDGERLRLPGRDVLEDGSQSVSGININKEHIITYLSHPP